MYGGSVGGRLVEKFNGVRESQIGIVGAESGERREARIALDANTVFDKDSGSASAVQQREVAAVGEKCDLAGGGVVQWSMPEMPVTSALGSPSRRQESFSATSESFIERLLRI